MSKSISRGAIAASVLSAAIFAALSATVTTAAAQDYPWCGVFRGGGERCSFATEAQCAASVSGTGGFCRMIPSAAMSSYAAEPRRRRK